MSLIESLFPEFENRKSYTARRHYVEGVMVELAKAKRLRLTDLFSLPAPLPDLCGEVLLGQILNDEGDGGRTVRPRAVPYELSAYMVRLRTLNGVTETVQKDAWSEPEQVPWTIKAKLPAEKVPQQRIAPDGSLEHFEVFQPRAFDTGETDVELPAPQAWWVLKQHGRGCRRAVRMTMQREYWKCEEVAREQPKRRGRPPKNETQASASQ